jgi:hypothetical protein
VQLPKKVQIMLESLLGRAGESEPALRRLVFERTRTGREQSQAVSRDLLAFVAKLDQRPWTIVRDDLSALRQAGYSEDQIFELIAAASAGAGVRRFEAGLGAIERAGKEPAAARGQSPATGKSPNPRTSDAS